MYDIIPFGGELVVDIWAMIIIGPLFCVLFLVCLMWSRYVKKKELRWIRAAKKKGLKKSFVKRSCIPVEEDPKNIEKIPSHHAWTESYEQAYYMDNYDPYLYKEYGK